jgi:hypothetical protein
MTYATPRQNFCKLKIRTVVTEEGTRVQIFLQNVERASIVYDYTALYDGAVHHNFAVCQLGGEKNKEVFWKYINITQCLLCHDSCHSTS